MAAMKARFSYACALLCFAASVSFPALAETWKSSVVLVPEKSNLQCAQGDVSKLFWG